MIYPGFIGSSYKAHSPTYASARLVNGYLEPAEKMGPKSEAILYGTPGTKPFLTLPTSPVRALWQQNGRAFAVAGSRLYELTAGGGYTDLGAIANPGGNATARIMGNGYQLLISSGTSGYIFNTNTNTLSLIPGWLTGAGTTGTAMVDLYFLAAIPGSRNFQYSALNDGLTWDPLNFSVKEGWGDNLVTLYADHREVWLFGSQTGEVWWNTGQRDAPFERIQGAFLEQGCGAALSVLKLDNSIMWLSADQRGSRMFWRANGYQPQRISTFPVESAIGAYSRVDDCVGYSYVDRGHTFAVWTFPSANATWAYDAATGEWSEREWWDYSHGTSNAVRGRTYCHAFGKHLVGDYAAGVICELDAGTFTDYSPLSDTGVQRFIREGPSLYKENKRITVSRFEVGMQTGLDVPTSGQGSTPLGVLQVSKDGGFTWSPEIQMNVGEIGRFDKRVSATRLGQARRWTPRFIVTDPIPRAVFEATCEMQMGLN
jgi:hypothetical protein